MVLLDLKLRPSTYREYYLYYQAAHRGVWCRRLNYLATLLGTVLTVIGVATLNATLAIAGVAGATTLSIASDVVNGDKKPMITQYPVWCVRTHFQLFVDLMKGKERF